MILVRIRKTNVKRLSSIVVRTRSTRMGIPLVGRNADVYADGFNGQGTRNVDDVVVGLRIGDCLGAFRNLGVLGCRCASTSIRLRSVELKRRQRVATHVASNGVIGSSIEAAVQRLAIVCLRLVVGYDDEFPLIIDVDYQVSFVACDLVCRLRRSGCSIKIRVMIYISIRCLILYCKGIALFDICCIWIMNRVAIHIEIVNGYLCCCIRDILKRELVTRNCELQFFR